MIKKKVCPKCGSENVEVVSSGDSNNFMCRECGYSGSCLEKPLKRKNEEK